MKFKINLLTLVVSVLILTVSTFSIAEENGTEPGSSTPDSSKEGAVESDATTSDSRSESNVGSNKTKAETLYELEGKINSVLDTLVEKNLLTRDNADEIIKSAEQQASDRLESDKKSNQTIVDEKPLATREKIIRVPYVPEHVKQQIRDEIRNGLREDTVQAVLGQAKQERWGMPGVTPEWVDRIKWKGDVRLRMQADMYDSKNGETGGIPVEYLDYQAINEEGGISEAGDDARLNISEDRERLRLRARLAMDALIATDFKAKFRITTGNTEDPVSTNATLGNYGNKYSLVLDRAYLDYADTDLDGYTYMKLYGGRMKNPWFSTDLVWDSDLAFDGLAMTYKIRLASEEELMEEADDEDTLFITLGAFPLEEVELSGRDKWLYGLQVRSNHIMSDQSSFDIAVSYYSYDNNTGKVNAFNDDFYDFTAPTYMQKGNTLFNITTNGTGDGELYALASDYDLLNVTLLYDMAGFAPYHVIFGLDYVKNIGYDKDEIERRINGRGTEPTNLAEEKTEGYKVEVSFGWPYVTWPDQWKVSLAYKYLESDAVLDAFTDSDFHLGGTNAKGYILRLDYGLLENTWFTFRYLSATAIEAADLGKFGIDTVQLDLNAKF